MKNFLYKNIYLIIFFLIIQIMDFIVFKLYLIDIKIFYLILEINLFCFTLFLFLNLLNYKKQNNLKKENENLKQKILELEKKYLQQEKNNLNYFILWLHQIKTPITALNLLLNQQNPKIINIKKEVTSIENYAELALNFLRLNEIHQTLNIEKINLNSIIKQNIQKLSILFIKNNINLKFKDEDFFVINDKLWVSVITEQLLNNAAKYTKNNEINIIYNKQENSLTIDDKGIGISKEHLPKIFNKGYSGGFSNNQEFKTSGLGLYIVKEACLKLRIKINIESEINVGTKITLTFPKNDTLQNC